MGAELPGAVDTMYIGGGTPSLLSGDQVRRIFEALRSEFDFVAGAEVTVECAPGQIAPEVLEAMLACEVNRISMGVQSFVDAESAAVGRMHTRAVVEREINRLRAVGVKEIGIDLIAGLPGQTAASWEESLRVVMDTGVPHVSVYMLEVDEDSRLGREAMAGGRRYGAGELPTEDASAEMYAVACERLTAGGLEQYEISNFARVGHASGHNLRYWERLPYVGFGLDAHSMLRSVGGAIRFANGDDLGAYLAAGAGLPILDARRTTEWISGVAGFEERMFLGLRMNVGVDLGAVRREFGGNLVDGAMAAIGDLRSAGMLEIEGDQVRLTQAGRMVSNEVFGRLLVDGAAAA